MKTLSELARDSALAIIFHVAPRFANALTLILIGRLAGPEQAGVFSLATTYLLIITVAMSGLDDLLIRQVARERESASRYLANFLLLRLASSIGLYFALMVILQSVLHYAATTTLPIAILTLGVLPDSLALVAEAVLLGQRRFGPPAIVLGVANGLKLIIGAIILLRGGGLIEIAWLWLIGNTLGMLVLLAIAIKQVGGMRRSDWLNFSLLKEHWRTALVFSVATVLTTMDSQTDTVLLSVLRNEAQVGWYGAATTITFSLLVLAQAYRFAVYPLMTRYAVQAPDQLARLFQKSVYYLSAIIMPIVTGVVIFAPPLVGTIFGPKFLPTVGALQILVISLLFLFLGEPCNRLMLVKDRQKVIVKFLVISALSNVALNLLLIPAHGATGAALARTCSSIIFLTLNMGYIAHNLILSIRFRFSDFVRPAVASVAMAGAAGVLLPFSILLSAVTGVATYLIVAWKIEVLPPEDARLLRQIIRHKIDHNHGKIET
jgi:O-antigen/teichoic acid export membrane protein